LLGAEPLYRGRAALRVAYRQDHMPGRVSGQQCACTFETKPELAPVTIAARVESVISLPEESA
jgi:hypothetical protein